MAFISQARQPRASTPLPFVGRTQELAWFREQVLLPDELAAHAITVWGPPGVGISALLARWRELAQSAAFADHCLSALVTDHLGSPLRVMTACAAQLREAGAPLVAFEYLLDHLTTTPMPYSSPEDQVAQQLFVQQVQALASARPVRGIPVIGGMYEAVSETTRTAFLQEHPTLALQKRQTLRQRLIALTHAFLDDLRHFAGPSGQVSQQQGVRIVLLLDEVSTASSELLAWVGTHVLPALQDMQLALVLAGSESLDRAFSAELQSITHLTLPPLSEEETHAFLAHAGITDAAQVARLWQKTGGLPLALRLLAPVPASFLDAQEEAISTGLRWIEQQGLTFEYLVRYGALLFRAFGSQDLAVCPMFSAQECIQEYRHLIALPFIHRDAMTGESAYHPLMQQQVLQRFAAHAREPYRHARQAVARYYQRQLERLRQQRGEWIMESAAGLHLVLALLEQWLWLADEASLGRAIAVYLHALEQASDRAPLTSWLRGWVQAGAAQARPEPSVQLAQHLLLHSQADPEQPAFLTAMGELLELIRRQADFPPILQARLLGRRAAVWLLQHQPRQALSESTQAVALDPGYVDGTLLQGMAYAALGKLEQAVASYDQAQVLDSQQALLWAHRGLAHASQHRDEQALEDATRLLLLAPDLPEAALFHHLVFQKLDASRSEPDAFERSLAGSRSDTDTALLQAMAHCALGHYEQALASFNQALQRDPTDARLYAGRGHVHLERGAVEQAQDLIRSWELNPHDDRAGLLLAWLWLCQDEPDARMAALLETLATRSVRQEDALLSQGMVSVLHQQFEQALGSFEQVLALDPQQGEAWFWKGVACAFLQRDSQALVALEQARQAGVPLPLALFRLLRRVAAVRPEFYQQQLLPLLQATASHSPMI
jgi:tetratricopeptide (TPR) repeat protein